MIAAANSSPLSLLAQTPAAADTPSSQVGSTFDAKAAARADQKIADLRDAVGKLKSTAASAKASPSDLAKAKLAALKERLKMLMMMGGDPKTVAREASKIAKEIGQAAKAYADSAGGSDSGAAAQASSDTAAAQQAAAAQGAAQTTAPQAANASDTGNQDAADPSQSADGSKTDAPDTSSAKSDDAGADPAEAKGQDPAQAQAKAASQPSVAHGGSAAPNAKLPDPVIEEARVLEASAKAIAKAALARLKAQHRNNPDEKTEQANLDQGEKDFNAAAKDIYGDTGVPGGGDASNSYAADGSAPAPSADTPLVSVKA